MRAQFERGLTDTSCMIGGNNGSLSGQVVEFSMEYLGFEKIPSRVMWLHNGKPIDPTKWTISISPSSSRIKADCLKPLDEGQYTCQISDLESGVHFESTGKSFNFSHVYMTKILSSEQFSWFCYDFENHITLSYFDI